MKLKTTLIAVAGLSLAAVVFAQTSQGSSSHSSKSSSSQSSSSSHASSSKSASANSNSSRNSNSGARSGNSSRSSGSDSDSNFDFSAKPSHAIMYTVSSGSAGSDGAKQKAFSQHTKYLGDVQAKGKVVFFGPWRDLPGSMAVVAVASDEEATQIAKNDPAVRSGALTFEVRAWLVMSGVSSQNSK